MRKMMVGMVLVSALIGMAAVGMTLALSLPMWTVVISYPTVCSLTLLLTAALWNIRSRQTVRADQPLRA